MEYGRIDFSEGINTNKTTSSCECIICHYWYFFRLNFRFQPKLYDSCHNMPQKSMSFNNVAIITDGRNDYRIHFCGMNKCEAVNSMKNVGFTLKKNESRLILRII